MANSERRPFRWTELPVIHQAFQAVRALSPSPAVTPILGDGRTPDTDGGDFSLRDDAVFEPAPIQSPERTPNS
jgi:hypothetical protein